MAFWADIKDLSRQQFVAALDAAGLDVKQAKPKRSRAPIKAMSTTNKSVMRIVQVLRIECDLSDDEARRRLVDALIARGYEQSEIPQGGERLEHWLEQLVKRISSADIFDAARNL